MMYIKTYEGLFDFLKRKNKRDYITQEEFDFLYKKLYIHSLVKVEKYTEVIADTGLSFNPKLVIKEVEVFIGDFSRNRPTQKYIKISISNGVYHISNHLNVYKDKDYNNIEDICSEVKKRVFHCILSNYIEPDTDGDNILHNVNKYWEDRFKESVYLIDDYSILNNNIINFDRLSMILNDYSNIKSISSRKSIINMIKEYFKR